MCELNNRTKEARPEDFVANSERFYIKRLDGRGIILWVFISVIYKASYAFASYKTVPIISEYSQEY